MLYDWLVKMGKQPLVVDACSLLKNPAPVSSRPIPNTSMKVCIKRLFCFSIRRQWRNSAIAVVLSSRVICAAGKVVHNKNISRNGSVSM